MKTTKICPKCGSGSIIKIKGNLGPYGSGNNIPTGWTYAKVDRYLCEACGYSEEWVDLEYIPKIKAKYGEKKRP